MKKNNLHIDNDVFLAKWLADEISDIDLKKLVSQEEFIAYQKIKKGIAFFDAVETPLEDSYAKLEQKIQLKKPTKVKQLYIKWAFSIAASLLLLFGINSFFNQQDIFNVTNFGEQKTIALLDGSEVILNANSKLNYSKKKWKNKRVVFLQGEAFFKVKKGKTFIVKTKNGLVEVLGTQFNVKSISDYFEVTCYSGKVRVVQNKNEKILLPNQSYQKISGSSPVKNSIVKVKKPNWLSGESTFNSVPIRYVLQELENQFKIKFEKSAIDENIIFTGSFPNDNKKVALKTVFDALEIKYKFKNENIIELQ